MQFRQLTYNTQSFTAGICIAKQQEGHHDSFHGYHKPKSFHNITKLGNNLWRLSPGLSFHLALAFTWSTNTLKGIQRLFGFAEQLHALLKMSRRIDHRIQAMYTQPD